MMSKLNQSASSFSRLIKSASLKMLLAPLGAVALLGLGGNFWLSGEANAQTTRNRPTQTNARSNVARLNLTLNIQPNESYDTLMRRADASARNVAIRSFNQNRSLGTVAVTVSGQHAGSIAPLLSLQVNRQNWANSPDTRRWATYFKNAPILLGLNTPNTNVVNQPANSNGAAIPGQAVNNGNNGNNGNNANGVNGNAAGNGQVPNNGLNTNVGAGTVNDIGANGTTFNNGNNLNNVPTTSGQGSNVPTTSGQGSNVPTTSGQVNGTNSLNNVPTTSGQGFDTNFNNTNGTTNGTGFNGGTNLNNTNGTTNGTGFNGGTNLNNTNGTTNGTGFGNTGGTTGTGTSGF